MATVKEAIHKILKDDAFDAGAGHLGNLLEHTSTPYGVFFMNPPKKPSFPLITYKVGGKSGRSPIPYDVFVDVKVWGGDCDAIQELVYGLLNNTRIVATDMTPMMLKWISAGPDIFDDNYKIYIREDRFYIRGSKA